MTIPRISASNEHVSSRLAHSVYLHYVSNCHYMLLIVELIVRVLLLSNFDDK